MPVWWKHYILLIFLLIHGFTHAETPDRLQAGLEKLLKTPSTNSDLILKQIAKLLGSHQKFSAPHEAGKAVERIRPILVNRADEAFKKPPSI